VTVSNLHDARRVAADKALAEHDFGPDMVSGSTAWDTDDDRHDEWTCVLSMDGQESASACGFVVRFEPGTGVVRDAHPGDPH
jgi:hypothetical protein